MLTILFWHFLSKTWSFKVSKNVVNPATKFIKSLYKWLAFRGLFVVEDQLTSVLWSNWIQEFLSRLRPLKYIYNTEGKVDKWIIVWLYWIVVRSTNLIMCHSKCLQTIFHFLLCNAQRAPTKRFSSPYDVIISFFCQDINAPLHVSFNQTKKNKLIQKLLPM